MKKVLKRILSIIVWILLLIVVAYNVYSFICIKVQKKDLASVNGYAILEVVSGSMEPTIKIGDLIIINQRVDNYKKNDIITFYDVNGSFVTHRIIEINNSEITTQGDANNSIDEPISKDKIVGRYVTRLKGMGILMKALKSPLVMVMILIIGIMMCFMVSTDKNGIPVDASKEEREFLEYKLNKNKNNKVEVKEEKKEEKIQQQKNNNTSNKNKNNSNKKKNTSNKKKHNNKKKKHNKKKKKGKRR